MATILNNVYPPIVPDVLPAFLRNKLSYKFYFSLPDTVSINQIKYIQISIVDTKTNRSVLNQHTGILSYGTAAVSRKTIKEATDLSTEPTQKDKSISGEIEENTGEYTYFDQYNYCLTINKDHIKDGKFKLNQYYKMQLRFIYKDPSNAQIPKTYIDYDEGTLGMEIGENLLAPFTMSYFYTYSDYFSEWSKPCLFRGIDYPVITIRNLDQRILKGSLTPDINLQTIILTNLITDIVGNLSFSSTTEEKEQGVIPSLQESLYLKSYSVKIYLEDDPDNAVVNSGEIYTKYSGTNDFYYEIPYNLLLAVVYIMEFGYTTNNLFHNKMYYKFSIVLYALDELDATISAVVDNNRGSINVNIKSNPSALPYLGGITIRRTSSESNFHQWQDVHNTYILNALIDYTWQDKTILSGVYYKYCMQKRDNLLNRGVVTIIRNPIMCILDDIYLTRKDQQLKIEFNPSLSLFKYNVTESQQTTLGSQYPFISRNSKNYYRSFPIGGLISSLIDRDNWNDPHYHITPDSVQKYYPNQFLNGATGNYSDSIKSILTNDDNYQLYNFVSKESIYGESLDLYNQYNINNNISIYDDYIYLKKFRDEVYKFLYDYNIKLFRSTTEGNILVKLMDIDFQPVESLGRRLYSFTATAILVDECSILNYQKYGIQDYEELLEVLDNQDNFTTYETIGQVYRYLLPNVNYSTDDSETNFFNIISNYILNNSPIGFVDTVKKLTYLRILSEEPFRTPATAQASKTTGHYFIINNNYYKSGSNSPMGGFVIPLLQHENGSSGFFELKGSNVLITDLRTKNLGGVYVTIDYVALVLRRLDLSIVVDKYSYETNIGQIAGSYNYGVSIINLLKNKYFYQYSSTEANNYYYKLSDVYNVLFESIPGAVVEITDATNMVNYTRHVIYNGYLNLSNELETHILDIRVKGVHLQLQTDPVSKIHLINLDNSGDHPERVTSLPTENIKNNHIYQLNLNNSIYDNVTGIVSYIRGESAEIRRDAVISPLGLILFLYENESYNSETGFGTYQLPSESTDESESTDDFNIILLLLSLSDEPLARNFVYYRDKWLLCPDQDFFHKIQEKLFNSHVNVLRETEFYEEPTEYSSILEIVNPKFNFVYNINGNFKIYYHERWYNFDRSNNDVICPVDIIVNYVYELLRGEYEKE